jgi:hypothetical protein
MAGRTLERIAELVCARTPVPPGLLADVEAQIACLPTVSRRAVGPALRAFDQAARLRYGRRFTRLDDARADAWLRHVLYHRHGPLATAVRLVKSLVVFCWYELPEVRAAIGYTPDAYVAEVTARRLARYGEQIRAAEERT